MDRRGSKVANTRARPSLVPVTNGDKSIDETILKSPVETISTLSPISAQKSHDAKASNLQELRFVITGSKSCGKTSFIQKALDLKKAVTSPSMSKKMSLDGQIFLISLVEIPLEDVSVSNGRIKWPSRVGDLDVPRVDGVLALYDVTKKESLSRIPVLLDALSNSPCVLVACKCDAPESKRAFDPDEIEEKCMEETGIEGIQTSPESSESHKRCISVVLRSHIDEQASRARMNGMRPRAMTTAVSDTPERKSKHGRATSEAAPATPHSDSISRRHTGSEPVPPIPKALALRHMDNDGETFSRDNKPKLDLKDVHSQPSKPAPNTPTAIANSFINFGGFSEWEEGSTEDDPVTPLAEEHTAQPGWTFADLVERLLAQPISRADHKFNATFLCLYRKFAAPAELFAAILESFEKLQKSDKPHLMRLGSQLRHLAILEQWLGTYPGDFAHPFLRTMVTDFVKKMSGNRVFAIAAHEMTAHLDSIAEDDDTDWAASDRRRGSKSVVRTMARVPSLSSSMSSLLSGSDLFGDFWSDTKRTEPSHSKSSSTASSIDRKTMASASSASVLLNSVEMAQRQADTLVHTNRVSLSKIQWHQFMDIPDEDHAKELTRIDRLLYSAIRPRDLIRHVSYTSDQRERCRGLEYVTQMIDQFNHVAFWVTNMLLLRDKAKHRARVLEKLMKVARKLRQANNYNGVGAILAGINSTAAHRLIQTRELVAPQIQKEFMGLEVLMASSKSHAAYRLAWENTTGARIPFLPLHRRDLVSAEEGNKTFTDEAEERINWKKFEVMGDVIIGIQESQGTAFQPSQRNLELQRLIMDTKLCKDEDELYERSSHLEPPRANESRRRFNWFQR